MSDSPRRVALDLAEHLRFLGESGVDGIGDPPRTAARLRGGTPPEAAVKPAGSAAGDAKAPGGPRESLDAVRSDLGDCTRCKLHTTRTNIVFGVGNPGARLLFVGEAPGADEDRQGEPFVGRAGKLLDKIIVAMGLKREDVYIANVLKCRPPGNRNPEPDEVEECTPFLFRQVDSIAPDVIVALGAPAAQSLLATGAPIGKLRGKFWLYRGVDLMPTYHPAFLLRNPAKKRDVWDDMQQVMERLGLPIPSRVDG